MAALRACRYVDEVVPDAPDVVTTEFPAAHDISLVVHGDDISDHAVETLYSDVAAAGKLRLVRREPGISTTDIIRRARHRYI